VSDPDGPYKSYAGGAVFSRRCPQCGRIVKADSSILINGLDEIVQLDNADCKKCGRIEMPFLGFFEEAQ
jgi:uncharacterized OB-fold protein